MEWLEFTTVVPSDVRLQTWLAFGFLLVCLLNTVGLLLAKFMRRSGEIGVRRALGASRAQSSRSTWSRPASSAWPAACSAGLALLGLWAVRQQPASYAELAQLDGVMLATTFALALVASLLAGMLPAWRAGRITPAIQLKSAMTTPNGEPPWTSAPSSPPCAAHKTAAALIVLEIALSCAIICNAVFMIGERIERMDRPAGLPNEIVRVQLRGIGREPIPGADPRGPGGAARHPRGVRPRRRPTRCRTAARRGTAQ
jgi:hypothetical protein